MAFCRLSTDDYLSDVYVNKTDEGYVVHQAVYHSPIDVSLLPEITADEETNPRTYSAQYRERHQAIRAQMKSLKPVALVDGGQSRTFATAAQCVEYLEALRAKGYHVPEVAMAALNEIVTAEEAAEEAKTTKTETDELVDAEISPA